MLLQVACLVVGYLLGSIPSAFIIAKLNKGIDIREIGSGNMGAANVMRSVGMWQGVIVAIADIGKGAATILLGETLGLSHAWLLGTGGAALLGHSFPVYIGFRGGQGVAPIIGVVAVLSPMVAGISCSIVGVALLLTRNVFPSIVIAAPFFLLTIWLFEGAPTFVLFGVAIILFIGFRSRRGLKQLIDTVNSRSGRR